MLRRYHIQDYILVGILPAFLLILYRKATLSPNRFLFETKGDAIKNYFTYASQIRSDDLFHGQFMNYPYGEHFLYLDCHPVLTIILHYLDAVFPWLPHYHIGILNFFMLVSVPFSAVFIYLILSSLNVNRWWSLFGALALMFMSPQLFRMTGHFALSYSFFIPLTWYIYIRYSKNHRRYTWSLIMAFNLLFWFFVHAYLGMVALSFVGLNLLLDGFVFRRNHTALLEKMLIFFIQVIVPAAAFFFFLKLSDHHIGRTDNPFGFFVFNATFESVFLPHHPPLKPVLTSIFEVKNQPWAGWSYIGLTSLIMLVIFLAGFLTRNKRPNFLISKVNLQVVRNPTLTTALVSGFILLLFSMAIPFSWGLEFLLDWFPLIKKFRGTGRFAWVFYYTVGVSSVFMLDYIYNNYRGRSKWFIRGIVIILSGAYIWEGLPWHQEISSQISTHPNYFIEENLPHGYKKALDHISDTHYQAIIPLPFYNKGSDNFGVGGTQKIYKLSMILAYHADIPILGSYATHTSIPEAKMVMQVCSPGYYDKEIKPDILSQEDFLIIYSKEKLNQYEKKLIEKGNVIMDDKDFSISTLPYAKLFENTSAQEILKFGKLKSEGQLWPEENFMTTNPASVVFYEDYDKTFQPISLAGKGSFTGLFNQTNFLFQFPKNTLIEGENYAVSFWMYNGGENYGQDALNSTVFIQEKRPSRTDWISLTNPATSMVINGLWSMVELSFVAKDSTHHYDVVLKGSELLEKTFYIDELLVRRKKDTVYKVLDEEGGKVRNLFKNNHRINVSK